MTRLRDFLRLRNIGITRLAREAGMARPHLQRILAAAAEPGRERIALLVSAARRITLEPVTAEELIELSQEESGPWRAAELARRTAGVAAREAVERCCGGEASEGWGARLADYAAPIDVALVRALVLESRETVDISPMRSRSLAAFALEVVSRLDADDHVAWLAAAARVEYANALRHLGDYGEALRVLDEMEEAASDLVLASHMIARGWYLRSAIHWKCHESGIARQDARRAGMLFGLLGDPLRVAYVQTLEAGIAFEDGDAARAKALLLQTLTPLKTADDQRALAAAYHSLGTAEGQLGNLDAAKVWFARALKFFKAKRVRPELARLWWSLGYFVGLLENRDRGAELIRSARAHFEHLGMRGDSALAGLDLLEVLLLEPAAGDAARLCAELCEAFSARGLTEPAKRVLAHLRAACTDPGAKPHRMRQMTKEVKQLVRHEVAARVTGGAR